MLLIANDAQWLWELLKYQLENGSNSVSLRFNSLAPHPVFFAPIWEGRVHWHAILTVLLGFLRTFRCLAYGIPSKLPFQNCQHLTRNPQRGEDPQCGEENTTFSTSNVQRKEPEEWAEVGDAACAYLVVSFGEARGSDG